MLSALAVTAHRGVHRRSSVQRPTCSTQRRDQVLSPRPGARPSRRRRRSTRPTSQPGHATTSRTRTSTAYRRDRSASSAAEPLCRHPADTRPERSGAARGLASSPALDEDHAEPELREAVAASSDDDAALAVHRAARADDGVDPGHHRRARSCDCRRVRHVRALHRLQPARRARHARLRAVHARCSPGSRSCCSSAASPTSSCGSSSGRCGSPPRRASSSPPANSSRASPSAARRASRRSPARSTGWPTACRARSAQLADLSQVQQRFVSDVSHELRTPLTTIRLAGDVLYDQRDDFPPATARTAELLHTQIAALRDPARRPARDEPLRRGRRASSRSSRRTSFASSKTRSRRSSRSPTSKAPSSGWSPPAGTSRPTSTRAASAASCRTCSATRSSTARRKPIDVYVDSDADAVAIAVRDHGIGMAASPMSSMSSTGSGAPTRPGSARPAARVSGSRSPWKTPRCTAACSRSGRSRGAGSCFRLTIPRRRGATFRGFTARPSARGSGQIDERPMTRRRRRGLRVALALLVLLAGCVGIPTSGSVQTAPIDADPDERRRSLLPDRPVAGSRCRRSSRDSSGRVAAPERLLGRAGSSSPADADWSRHGGVLISSSADRSGPGRRRHAARSLCDVAAEVDATGRYVTSASTQTLLYDFTVVDGELRISRGAPGRCSARAASARLRRVSALLLRPVVPTFWSPICAGSRRHAAVADRIVQRVAHGSGALATDGSHSSRHSRSGSRGAATGGPAVEVTLSAEVRAESALDPAADDLATGDEPRRPARNVTEVDVTADGLRSPRRPSRLAASPDIRCRT